MTVAPGGTSELPVQKLNRQKVSVRFNSKPGGKKVYLVNGANRTFVGKTPVNHDVPVGKNYTVEYICESNTVVKQPLDYTVLAAAAAAEAIHLDAVECGMRSKKESPKKINVHSAKHIIEPPDKIFTVGYLSVQTTPWSRVFINDTFEKNTPVLKKELKPGQYRITLKNDAANIDKSFIVIIKQGKTSTIVERFK